MKLDFKNEKTKLILGSTLSVLGITLIVISFNIPKNDNKISSNNTSYQNNNQKVDNNNDLEDNIDNNDDIENLDKEDMETDDKNEEQKESNNDNQEETLEKEEINTNKKEPTNLKNTLTIYKNSDGYCKDKTDTCNTIAYTIIVDNKDAKILEINNNYMLYKDNILKIYNINTKETNKLNLDNTDEETYKFITNKDKLIGLIYKDKETNFMGYYNLNDSLKMYENKYTNIDKTDYDNYLIASYPEEDKINYHLLKIEEEKVELEDKTNNSCELSFEIYKNNTSEIFIEHGTCHGEEIKNIYSNSKKIIASNLLNNDYYSIYNNNIYINDNNMIKKYDFEGNLLDNKKVEGFKQLIRNNVIYVENDNLFLYDMNTKENIKFGEWSSNNNYLGNDTEILTSSGYKTSKNLDTINNLIDEKVTDEGIYLIISYKEEDSEGNLGIIYFYNRDKGVRIYNIKKNS